MGDEKKKQPGNTSFLGKFFSSNPKTPSADPGPILRSSNRTIINIWTSEANRAVPGHNVGHMSIELPGEDSPYVSFWPAPREHKITTTNPKDRIRRRYFGTRPPEWKPSYAMDCIAEGISEGQLESIENWATFTYNQNTHQVVAMFEDKRAPTIIGRNDPVPEGAVLFCVKPIPANVRLTLYNLESGPMLTSFAKLQNTTEHWRLIGSNSISRLDNTNAENCASAALTVMQSGGLNLGKLYQKSKASSQNSTAITPDAVLEQVLAAKRYEMAFYPADDNSFKPEWETDIETLEQNYQKGTCLTM